MIYLEEKDGMIYKYKVDIDEERLKELILKIEEGNFYYNHDVEEGTLTYKDLDFTSYIDFDEDSISREKGLSYELVLYSNLYKLASRLLEYDVISKSNSDEYDKMYALYELESYSGEVDLVSLIDKEIEKRKDNLYSGLSKYDFNGRLTRLYILKELYNQREEATSLPDITGFYSDIMNTITYEKIDEISLEDYTKYRELCKCDNNSFLVKDGKYINKNKVCFDMNRLVYLLRLMQMDTRYKDASGKLESTELEKLLIEFINGKTNITSLLSYEPNKEKINIYRIECMEQSKKIGALDSNSVDDLINVTEEVRNSFPYAEYNMSTVPTYGYYEKILCELNYESVFSMDIETYKKVEEFESEISEEVASKLVLSK